jgi:hypothetical protein
MKKLLVTTAIFLVGAASMMAQGRIAFQNTSATGIRISNPLINGGASVILGTASTALFGIGPASVQISLMAGTSAASMVPVMIGTAANQPFVLNSASLVATFQGTFAGGNPLPLAGFDGLTVAYLQMSIVSLNGLYAGVSPIIQVTPVLTPAVATGVFSATVLPNTWNLNTDFHLVPVPEPSSMVLAGLGAASLLMFRRRK